MRGCCEEISKESAFVLFADHEAARKPIGIDGAYLAVPNVGVLGSHGSIAARFDAHEDLESRSPATRSSDSEIVVRPTETMRTSTL